MLLNDAGGVRLATAPVHAGAEPLPARALPRPGTPTRALKHYAEQPGPHAAAAGALYLNLREALLSNIAAQYERTGYLWEQYGDADGGGKGCRPFTGWTGLVALIAAEIYD
mmetsp:Transcript_35182/g.88249  ORF Transcript_35182/g.88249 Transcript_35182/m.88249 type:complete len:111 (-) Transcript_35182:113-445(-)